MKKTVLIILAALILVGVGLWALLGAGRDPGAQQPAEAEVTSSTTESQQPRAETTSAPAAEEVPADAEAEADMSDTGGPTETEDSPIDEEFEIQIGEDQSVGGF